jgi:hypothetical protein
MGLFDLFFGGTYYHGTRASLGSGARLKPSGSLFGSGNHGIGGHDEVYVTTDPEAARWYANSARGFGRARVYKVRAGAVRHVDDSYVDGEWQANEWSTSAAYIEGEYE